MDSKSTYRAIGDRSVISGGCQSPNRSIKLLRRDMKTFYGGLGRKSTKAGFNHQDTKDILASSDEEEEAGDNQQGSLQTIKIQFNISKNNSSSNLLKN
jgi:hypothetical protein